VGAGLAGLKPAAAFSPPFAILESRLEKFQPATLLHLQFRSPLAAEVTGFQPVHRVYNPQKHIWPGSLSELTLGVVEPTQ